jgi:hypothetical protein
VILDTSLSRASKPVLPTLHVRLESPNALWRLSLLYHKAVLEARGLYPILSVTFCEWTGKLYAVLELMNKFYC